MSSKPWGLEFYPPWVRRRIIDNREFETTDVVKGIASHLEYNRTAFIEANRLAQRTSAEISRANRDMVERCLQDQRERGEELVGGLRDIAWSLESLETSLSAKLDDLNHTARAAVSMLSDIFDVLFHIATGADYNATLRRRAAEAEEARRQQVIVADYKEALVILSEAASETNASKQRLQMKQAEHCLRKALSVSAIEAHAAMSLGTLLLARDDLQEAEIYYERSVRVFTRWSPQWVYASRLLANVESHAGAPQKARERMAKIISYRTSLTSFSDEVRGINRDEDYDVKPERLRRLLAKIHFLGGSNPEGFASIEAKLHGGKEYHAVETLKNAEPQLLKMFEQAQPDPDVFYDAARFTADCGDEGRAAQHLKTRSQFFGQDLLARRAFLLQIQATPEFSL